MALNIKLKTKILESGRLQKDISNSLDMHASKFSEIVQGWHEPDIEVKKAIAKELNCKVNDIF